MNELNDPHQHYIYFYFKYTLLFLKSKSNEIMLSTNCVEKRKIALLQCLKSEKKNFSQYLKIMSKKNKKIKKSRNNTLGANGLINTLSRFHLTVHSLQFLETH